MLAVDNQTRLLGSAGNWNGQLIFICGNLALIECNYDRGRIVLASFSKNLAICFRLAIFSRRCTPLTPGPRRSISDHSSTSPADAAKTQNDGAALLSRWEKNVHAYVLLASFELGLAVFFVTTGLLLVSQGDSEY